MRSHGKHYKIQFTSNLFRSCVYRTKKTNEIRFIFQPNALFIEETHLMEIFLRPANGFSVCDWRKMNFFPLRSLECLFPLPFGRFSSIYVLLSVFFAGSHFKCFSFELPLWRHTIILKFINREFASINTERKKKTLSCNLLCCTGFWQIPLMIIS